MKTKSSLAVLTSSNSVSSKTSDLFKVGSWGYQWGIKLKIEDSSNFYFIQFCPLKKKFLGGAGVAYGSSQAGVKSEP